MTNLIEKALIIGFGIFVLIIFIGFITPFYNQTEKFNAEDKDQIDDYLDFITQLDNAITSVIEQPNKPYNDNIQCFEGINIILEKYYVKLYFLLENEEYSKILEYPVNFYNDSFNFLISDIYTLQIYFEANNSLIKITFIL